MAFTVTEVNTVSDKHFDKVLKQQCYDNSAFYQKAKKMKQVVPGGTKITWPIRYDQLGSADAVSSTDRIIFERKATRTQCFLEWKYYSGNTMMGWDEKIKNSGKAAIVDLIADKTEELKQDLDHRFATDLYTTNPNGSGFSSLATIVDSEDTYAGVAVSDASAWAAIEDSTTTELIIYGGSTTLAGMIGQATYGKNRPNFHLTTKLLRDKFESKLEPKQRYTSDEMASLGFEDTISFHGAPVIGDAYCTANTWYGLDMKVFYVVYHPSANFKATSWKEMFQAGFPHHLAKEISWVGNIKCKMRRCNFKYTALDSTL